jgi:hypothetical protein
MNGLAPAGARCRAICQGIVWIRSQPKLCYRDPYLAQPVDSSAHHLSALHGTYSFWSARHDDVTRLQCHGA